MQREVHHITIENDSTSELLRVAREVQRSGIPTVIHANGEEIAKITPAEPVSAYELPKKQQGANDWLKPLIGMGAGSPPHDASENVDTYLAQAVYDESHPRTK